jgi:RimJ/RimL family protein N-acetyltransferase
MTIASRKVVCSIVYFNSFERLKVEQMNSVTLENERVKLTPLVTEDLEKLLPIAIAHPDLLQYSPSAFGSREALLDYIQIGVAMRKPFLIFDKKNNAFAGSSSYGNISAYDKRLEIGWTWVGERFHGTGLNKAVKFLMLSHAFETLQFARVAFKIDSRNGQSRAAICKIGAVLEGQLRSHTLLTDGYRRTTCCYSILQSEWLGIKKTIFKEFL